MACLRGSLWGDMEGGREVNGPGRAPDSGPLDHTASLLAGLLQDSCNKGAGLDLSAHLPGPGAPDAELGLPRPHVPGPWHRAPSRASRGRRHAAREMGTCPGLRLLAGPAEPSCALVRPPRSSPLGGGVPTLPWETRKQAQEGEPGALGGEADPVLEARAASPGCLVPTDLAHGVHWTRAWGQAGPREVTPTAGRSTGRMRMLCVGASGRGGTERGPADGHQPSPPPVPGAGARPLGGLWPLHGVPAAPQTLGSEPWTHGVSGEKTGGPRPSPDGCRRPRGTPAAVWTGTTRAVALADAGVWDTRGRRPAYCGLQAPP